MKHMVHNLLQHKTIPNNLLRIQTLNTFLFLFVAQFKPQLLLEK